MKKLSTEQKAKRYDEAITKAKNCLKDGTITNTAISYIEFILPELKESYDENIRKALIKMVHNTTGDCLWVDYNVHEKDAIAWLEKRGEPQVRTGIEWVNTIDDACDKRYSEEYAHGEYCHEQSFKWGFQEGVDWLEKQGEQKLIDKIQLGKMYKCIASPRYSTFVKDLIYVPQDKFLCSLMNFYSDCFEPIEDDEQKPAFEMKTPEESLGIDSDTYNKIVDECIYGEQKPAWSEEDKDILFRTINDLNFLKDTISIDSKYAVNIIDIEREITWLKDLKDRVQSQNTWKPSDTEINILQGVIDGSFKSENVKVTLTNILEQLKKLREE